MTKEEMLSYPVPAWTNKKSWIDRIETSPWSVECIILGSYKCVDCGSGHKKLVVHHIDESRKLGKLNNNRENLVPLCHSCHRIRHSNMGANRVNVSELIKNYLRISGGIYYSGMYSDISRELGISRERVRQIANKLGMKPYRVLKHEQSDKKCLMCGKNSINKSYCSDECRKKYVKEKYWTNAPCKECGKDIPYLKSREYIKPVFCSKHCQGVYIGKTVGFKAGESYRESNRNLVLSLTGKFTVFDIAKKFNISLVTARSWVTDLVIQDLIGSDEYVKGKGARKNYFVKRLDFS